MTCNHEDILVSKLPDWVKDDVIILQKKPLKGPQRVRQQRSSRNGTACLSPWTRVSTETNFILCFFIVLIPPRLAKKQSNVPRMEEEPSAVICCFKGKRRKHPPAWLTVPYVSMPPHGLRSGYTSYERHNYWWMMTWQRSGCLFIDCSGAGGAACSLLPLFFFFNLWPQFGPKSSTQSGEAAKRG